LKFPLLEIAGVWAVAIVGAYIYATQVGDEVTGDIDPPSVEDLTQLLALKVDAVAGYGMVYSVPASLLMAFVFLVRSRVYGSWWVTGGLVLSSALIILMTEQLVINSVLN